MKRLSLRVAASQVGVSPLTLRRWAYEGLVTYYLVGPGRYMQFEQADIDALLASMRRERHTPPIA
jgi:predicted site-specific integrase-resolvase